MRVPLNAASLACLALLCGCVAQDPATLSQVSGVDPQDAMDLSVFAGDILANSFDPHSTTLRVMPFAEPVAPSVRATFEAVLRERGFALSPDGMDYPGAVSVRLAIMSSAGQPMMSVFADDAVATCPYSRPADGAIVRAASCTLRPGTTLALRVPETLAPLPSRSTPVVATQLASASASTTPAASTPPIQATTTVAATPASTPATPQAPIVATAPPAPQWVLSGGTPIREQIISWGARAGWTVEWPLKVNWSVPATASFAGEFDDRDHGPVAQVVQALASEGREIRARFFPANRMLIINPGDAR